MVTRYPKYWKWLPFAALGLMFVGDFAPVSDSLDETLTGMAIPVLLVFSGTYYLHQWRMRQGDQSSSAAISSSDQT